MVEFTHAAAELNADITPIDSPARRNFFRVAMAVVALEPAIILGALIYLGAPWWVIAGVFAIGTILVAAIFWIISLAAWRPWERRYPAQPILDGAVSQSWQSFSLGSLSRLNNCVTIIADRKHLHLVPFAPLRWTGSGRISLPLDRMEEVQPGTFPRFGATGRLDGWVIAGPDWCMRLANADGPS